MSQRSYANDRYRKDAKIGSTRKSAAKAKPVRKQGTVETTSAAKPKKPGQEKDWTGLPTSPQMKKWRRIWWALILPALGIAVASILVPELRADQTTVMVTTALVFILSMAAVTIDTVVIRRLRKDLIAQSAKNKPPKHAGPKAEAGKKDAS